jgi:hypothetical protein
LDGGWLNGWIDERMNGWMAGLPTDGMNSIYTSASVL